MAGSFIDSLTTAFDVPHSFCPVLVTRRRFQENPTFEKLNAKMTRRMMANTLYPVTNNDIEVCINFVFNIPKVCFEVIIHILISNLRFL